MSDQKYEKVICEDCGCLGELRSWGLHCERCEASMQLNQPLEEIRMLEKIIKRCEKERDSGESRIMSRQLDAAIAKARGYIVKKEHVRMNYYATTFDFFIRKGGDDLPVKMPYWSTNGNDMLELDEGMRERGWRIELIELNNDDDMWSCEYMLARSTTGIINYSFAKADTEPLARALAAYQALTGKEWVE